MLKNIYSLKNTLFIFTYYIKKCPFSQRYNALMSFFSNFPWKTPCCRVPIWWNKKVNSVKTTPYYGQKKFIRCLFFRFREKIDALVSIFCQNMYKHTALMPIFCQLNTLSLKNTILLCHFCRIFDEKPPPFSPLFSQKTSILSKLHYILDEKNQDAHFFFSWFSTKKSLLSHPYYVNKTSFL